MPKDATTMQRMTLFALIMLLAAAFSLTAADSDSTSGKKTEKAYEITWMRYDEGLAKAAKEDKHVFIDFTTSWCGWCKKMDAETFSDPYVIQLVNDHFVPIQVDGDSKRELDIDGYKISEKNLTAREYGVNGYPSFWFLKPDGTKIGMIRGYRPKPDIVEVLEFVKNRGYDTISANEPQSKDEGRQKK
jgi:thioredoxin-related protein